MLAESMDGQARSKGAESTKSRALTMATKKGLLDMTHIYGAQGCPGALTTRQHRREECAR